jgi:hypothetical protein
VGRAARDDEASTPCVGCRDIPQSSFRITSTPPQAWGLAWASSRTGATQAAERHHQESSSQPPDHRQRGRAPTEPSARWLP